MTVDYLSEDPILTITGSCPGEITIGVSGAVGGARLYASEAVGSSVVVAGACTGTELGLAPPPHLTGDSPTDMNGDGSTSRVVGPEWCGRFLQLLVPP